MKICLAAAIAMIGVSHFGRAGESEPPLIVTREYRVPPNAFPEPAGARRTDGKPNWQVQSAVPFTAPPIPSYLYIPSSQKLLVRGDVNHQREAKARVAELWRKAKTKKGNNSK